MVIDRDLLNLIITEAEGFHCLRSGLIIQISRSRLGIEQSSCSQQQERQESVDGRFSTMDA